LPLLATATPQQFINSSVSEGVRAHREGHAAAAGSSFHPSTVCSGGFIGDGQIWQWQLKEAWIWLGEALVLG
jgi:hypothetical protein